MSLGPEACQWQGSKGVAIGERGGQQPWTLWATRLGSAWVGQGPQCPPWGLSRGGEGGGGADLADPSPLRPNHPHAQNQNNFPLRKNEILNREPEMRGPFSVHTLFVAIPPHSSPPRMVTCGLPRVVCCWGRRQHNMQHMQFTRMREKLVKSLKTALGAFRRRSEKKWTLRIPPPPEW